ncbi:hypothetical protein [Lacipirellula sp.]|uniref:hypothetical protein n=1 Tax=Lacipirellula sp. TaxID=2691419 RepID=UPI003D13DEC1
MKQAKNCEFFVNEISEENLGAVMERCPNLGAFGFGSFGQYHPEFPGNATKELKQDRGELLRGFAQFQTACEWLAKIEKSRSTNQTCSSYALKHRVERFYAPFYCCNGAFIAAAIHMGFKWVEDGPNACFNMKQASLDRLL